MLNITITEDNRADVEAQLTAIDEAKLGLSDEEIDALDITRYLAAVEALLALDDLGGADIPMPIAFPEDLSGGGTGDADNPYQISTADEMKKLSEYVNTGNETLHKHFKLMADIDLGGEENPWTPIGDDQNPFFGTFDGGGHTVSGLYVDNSSDTYSYVGLFGCIQFQGTVKSLGVSGNINGGNVETGGIAGRNYGTIVGCHSACTIQNGGAVGGITGQNYGGTVEDCYNVSTVSNDGCGGIAGINMGSDGKVSGCYNAGSVNGNGAGGIVGYGGRGFIESCYNVGAVKGQDSGGIAGENSNNSSITKCYFLEGTANNGVGSGGAIGVEQKSETEFRSLADTLGEGWTDDPFLGRPVLENNQEPWPIPGDGSQVHPFEISNKEELEKVRDYLNSAPGHGTGQYFKLTQDINLDSEDWTPIGDNEGTSEEKAFHGIFDGGGHTVRGLSINDVIRLYRGLFSVVGNDGRIMNLSVEGSITGTNYAAGIVGKNRGTVENCHSNVNIDGVGMYHGGIAGSNYGTVENCSNTGTIQSSDVLKLGGIVGWNNNGTVKSCYNTGNISVSNSCGAIAGENGGTVTNCYYLNTCGVKGDGTSKTAEEFASGEVAWLLQDGQDEQNVQVWGQALKGILPDEYPVLTNDSEKKVYKVTFRTKDQEEYDAKYTNTGGTVTLPADPEVRGMIFDHWSREDSISGDKFNETTQVTTDITVFAVGRKRFAGDAEDIEVSLVYGYTDQTEIDLDTHMHFEDNTDADGKFNYVLTDNSAVPGASVDGSILTIPTGLNAGTYSLTVTASKAPSDYSMISVGSFGTDPVTLTVTIIINKADSTVQTPPSAITGLTYTGAEQELVTAGSGNGGEMQYSLDQSGSYSTTIPTGTEAKSYTVWYKVVGDGNHNDTEPQSVPVTIGKGKADVSGNTVTVTYGESVTLTVNVALKVPNGIMLTSAGQNKVEFSFPKGGTITADVQKAFGENGTASVTIEAEDVKNYFYPGSNEVIFNYGGSENLAPEESLKITVMVNRKALDFTFTATDRIYTGSNVVTGTLERTTGLVGSDSVTENLEEGAATAASADVGTQEVTVNASKVELGGSDVAYYVVGTVTGGTVVISKATSSITVPAITGTYGEDITITAEVTVSGVDSSLITGEVTFKAGETELGKGIKGADNKWVLTLTKTNSDKEKALFDTKTVTADYAGNENIEGKDGSNATNINQRTLEYNVTATAREYEPGKTEVEVSLTPKNLVEGDEVTLTAKGKLSAADADTYESVSLTEIAIGGTDEAYYTVASTADDVTLTSPVTISKAKAKVLTQPTGETGLIYTGEPLSLLSDEATSNGGTMQYCVGEKGSTDQPDETAAWKEDFAGITAVDAGTYTIWYRANGDADYTTSDLGSIEVTIGKAMSTVAVQPVTDTYGEDITITAEVTAPGVDPSLVTGTIEFTDGDIDLGSAPVENGTATLTVPGADRDKQHALFGTDGSSTITATYSGNDNIGEGTGNGTTTISLRTLEYDVTAMDREYVPGKTEVEVSLIPTDLVEGDNVTLTATGNLSAANAGTYESVRLTDITIGGADAKYYEVGATADNVPLTSPVTISKAKAELKTPPTGKEGLIYTGEPLSLLSVEGTSVGGTMQYTVGEKDSTEQPNETAVWKESITDITATDAGTYTIWYRANGDVDYTTSDLSSITVTIGKATPTVTVQPVTGTYGEGISITAEITIPGVDPSLVTGTIEFTDGGTVLGSASVQNGTATLTVSGTDRDKQHALFGTAGTSTVTAAYSGNDNINEGTGNGTATISKRELQYSVTATDRAFEAGKTEVEVTLTLKNLIDGDSVTLTATGNLSSANAGTYNTIDLTDITIGGADAKYYKVDATSNNVPLTSPVTISKAKAELKTPPTGKEGLTYNGEPQSLLSGEGTSTGGTMQYTVGGKDGTEQPDETANWKDAITDITATEAGTYTIWYRAKEDADYATSDLGSITVSIGKATPTVTVPAVTGTYGEDITITVQVTASGVDPTLVTGTIEFTDGDIDLGSAPVENGTATLTVPGADRDKQHALFGTDGSSTITATYSGNDNIGEGTGNGTTTISLRTLEYDVTAMDREYVPGKTEVEVSLIPTDLVEGDTVILTATGNLSSANAGTYEIVRLTRITMGGADAKYYGYRSLLNTPSRRPVCTLLGPT